MLPETKVVEGLARNDIRIFYDKPSLERWLDLIPPENCTLLFMSSGNFGGFDPMSYRH